ncbi:hypothetical protein HY36_16310 [Hyphomonas atlantica]|uniref:Uncharacterized protein n=1 Tax=Hyphomonas atlantica TaxID=1280948 RepID=A0A059E3D0_9PROT|nr:hypothetical protein HY36_16310 [Hyphomonas atlantica]|tara:strand:+ start:215 stop:328 length:114 start_codon:yes stop_codon:yes gene_type:complete
MQHAALKQVTRRYQLLQEIWPNLFMLTGRFAGMVQYV